ncbi:MAG: extracellular solute-binding protein [Oscillospiraceae bacterium]|nr:extracellular solute-binding protein [Oscillospiraceae bacterium]
MKRLFTLLLCLFMVASALTGCYGGKEAAQTGEKTVDKFDLDIPKDHTFRIGLAYNRYVTDYENNALTKWLREKTGYNIEIISVYPPSLNMPTGTEQYFVQKFDIIMGINFGRTVANDHGEKGLAIDLAPYFNSEAWSGQWWARLNDLGDREFADYVTRKLYADDGKSIYAFPTIEYSRYDMIRHQVFINQEWLDALELPMPTNADELYDTLVAFKTQDPNGNRKADEIPLLGCTQTKHADVISWIVNMFCYMEDARSLRVDDSGKISGFFWDDDYRDALIFLNKLVKEGLMPKDVFTMTNSELAEQVDPAGEVETVGIWVGNPSEILKAGSDAVNVYRAMPQWGYAVTDMGTVRHDTVVTGDCAYPAGAWKILMALSSEEGYYRMRYGEKDVDWVEAASGAKSYTGQDAKVQLVNGDVFGGTNAKTWNLVCSTISTSSCNEQVAPSNQIDAWEQAKLKMMGDCYRYHYERYDVQGGRPDDVILPLIYTSDEDGEVAVHWVNTNNWYKTAQASFIMGEGELDNPADKEQWQKYMQGFTTAGYDAYVEAAQKAYNKTWGAK